MKRLLEEFILRVKVGNVVLLMLVAHRLQ